MSGKLNMRLTDIRQGESEDPFKKTQLYSNSLSIKKDFLANSFEQYSLYFLNFF